MGTFLIVQQALETWRDAERLLAELPPESPEHAEVGRALAQSRVIYNSLIGSEPSGLVLAQAAAVVNDARAVLQTVRSRRAGQPTEPAR